MAAPAVARYLQDTTGISIKRITRTLKPLQDATTNLNGHHHQPQRTPPPSPPPTPEAENIPTTLNPNRTPKLRNLGESAVLGTGLSGLCSADSVRGCGCRLG